MGRTEPPGARAGAAPTKRPTTPTRDVAILVALALFARLVVLGRNLWYDEVIYSTREGADSLRELAGALLFEPPAPLYRLLTYFWVRLFGESDLAVRAPSLLFGLGTIALLYVAGRHYGGRRVGLIAGALLALSPAHVWYSAEATPYAMALFLLLGSFIVATRYAREEAGRGGLVLYTLLLSATLLTHFFAALFVVPLALIAFLARGARRRELLLATGVAGAAMVAFLALKMGLGSQERTLFFLRPFTLFEAWMLLFHWFTVGNALWTVNPYLATPATLLNTPAALLAQLFFLVLLVRGLWPARGERVWLSGLAALILFPIAILWLLTLVGLDQLYIERYMLGGLPFFYIAIARGATRPIAGRSALPLAGALVIVILVALVGLGRHPEQWTVYKAKPAWAAAAAHLAASQEESDGVVLRLVPLDPLAFYLRRLGREGAIEFWFLEEGVLDRLLAERDPERLHLVVNRSWEGQVDLAFELLDGHRALELEAVTHFPLIEIHTYRRR